jgi:O-succinylbenzoic acid--CoA ligase
VARGRRWTWRELELDVRRFEAWLEQRGVAPGDRIATLAGNRAEVVFLFHALARLGATFVPLNARLTAAELGPLHAAASPRFCLADDALRERLPGAEPWPTVLPPPHAEAPEQLELDAVAAGLFTSGTTGTPKLVELTHANFHANIHASAQNLGTRPDDAWLGTLPLFHVGGLVMMVRCAVNLATLVLEPGFDVARVDALIDAGEVTLVSLVPSTLGRLLELRGERPYRHCPRALLIGGGPMGPALLSRARALGLNVLQTYGLTEACSQVTTERPEEADGETAGAPLPGLEVRIHAPAGGVGEIQVRGPTVWRGAGEWLETKDLGRLDSRGRLQVLSRRVDLIVSGGENVYPAEVEQVLAQHAAVVDVAVLPLPDAAWGQRVIAAVVWRAEADAEGLLAWARTRLAGFKVPRAVVTLEGLPRNAGGKLDRRALLARISEEF